MTRNSTVVSVGKPTALNPKALAEPPPNEERRGII
jgi:hypothetical protein